MAWPSYLLIALGGGAGALARYGTGRVLGAAFGWEALATLAINVAGAFALGIAAQLLAARPSLFLLLATGFLGAFTTFSTFAMDAVGLLQRIGALAAASYVAGSVLLALLAFAGGATLAGAKL